MIIIINIANFGIIPARAGFTAVGGLPVRCRGDHPRSRGVYGALDPVGGASHGSSPLARGLPPQCGAPFGILGIIPARAGFTMKCPPPITPPTDHPRSRGVYSGNSTATSAKKGSSPLARGLPMRVLSHWRRRRIIPARAGFTWVGLLLKNDAWDHPRSRGVYPARRARRILLGGSSPLARGLRDRVLVARREGGIIPARAGFTAPRRF